MMYSKPARMIQASFRATSEDHKRIARVAKKKKISKSEVVREGARLFATLVGVS